MQTELPVNWCPLLHRWMVVLDFRNTAVKRFIGRTREEDGIEHKELTHMELIDTQEGPAGVMNSVLNSGRWVTNRKRHFTNSSVAAVLFVWQGYWFESGWRWIAWYDIFLCWVVGCSLWLCSNSSIRFIRLSPLHVSWYLSTTWLVLKSNISQTLMIYEIGNCVHSPYCTDVFPAPPILWGQFQGITDSYGSCLYCHWSWSKHTALQGSGQTIAPGSFLMLKFLGKPRTFPKNRVV